MPSPPMSRRAALATLASAALAGCSATSLWSSDSLDRPEIDCGPTAVDWPTYGYDAARTSALGARPLPSADAELARFSHTGVSPTGGGSVGGPPVVDEGVAYVAGDLRIEAIDIETEARLWTFEEFDDSIGTSPTLACGVLFVSGLNETFALDPTDGTLLWRADAGSRSGPHSSPTARDGFVFVPGSSVVALDAETGTQLWRTGTEHVAQGLAVTDRVYVGTGSNGTGALEALTRCEGERWWRATETGSVYSPPAVAGDTVYAASKHGHLTALASEDGSVRWQRSIESGVYEPPAVASGRVFVCAGNGDHAYAFDAESGNLLWRFETGVSQSAPVVLGESVLLTSANEGVFAVDVVSGEPIWHSGDLGIVDSQPVVVDGQLFFVSGTRSEVSVFG